MAALPYMQLYVAEYLADTAHLTAAQHGAYMLLLMNYWQRGKALKNSDDRLAVTARMSPEEWADNKGVLAEFFQITDAEWIHHRVDRDLAFVEAKSTANRTNGKLGGRKPNSNRTLSERKPNGYVSPKPNESETEPNSKPLRTEQIRTEQKPPSPPSEPVFDHDMVATAVMAETGASGLHLRVVLAEIALNAIGSGKRGEDVRDFIIGQWAKYKQAIPRLEWVYGSLQKFLEGALWQDEKLWPWKDGTGPPKAPKMHDPLEEIRREREAALKEIHGSESAQPAS